MTKQPWFKYIIIVLVLWLSTALFFSPLFNQQVLLQQDIIRHKGMSKDIVDFRASTGEEPLWTNRMFGGMPAFQISTLYSGNWLSIPDTLMKCFMPLPAGYLFMYMLCFLILMSCMKIPPLWSLAGSMAYGFSSYFLIILEAGHNSKANAIGYLPALIGGLHLLFNSNRPFLGFSITALFTALELNANHIQISYYGYILVACFLVYYFIQSIQAVAWKSYIRSFLFFVLASLLGVLPNAGNLLTTQNYSVYTTRGPSELTGEAAVLKQTALDEPISPQQQSMAKAEYLSNKTSGLDADYATQWSYGIGESMTLLIPNFKGGASKSIREHNPSVLKGVNPEFTEQVAASSAYFGDQPFTSGPVYAGAAICFLAVLALFYINSSIKWVLLAATLISLVLSWGHHVMGLTKWCMDYIPGYNKFRAVSMTLVIAELTLPLLAVLALYHWFSDSTENSSTKALSHKKRSWWWALSLTAGFCLLCYVAPEALTTLSSNTEPSQWIQQAVQSGISESEATRYVGELMPNVELARKHLLQSDAGRSLVLIVLTAMVMFLGIKYAPLKKASPVIITLLILVDLWSVNKRYLNTSSFISKEQEQAMISNKTSADEEILRDREAGYRVLNLSVSPFNDAQTSYWHHSVGGYHAAKLKSYQEFIDYELDAEIKHIFKNGSALFGSDSSRQELLKRLHGLNLLNTRYFILPGGEERTTMAFKNPRAYGPCWFAKEVKPLDSKDAVLLQMRSQPDKQRVWVLKKNVPAAKSYALGDSIRLISKKANACKYVSDSKGKAFAVFSEIYYPDGWNVYVDGKQGQYVCVNSILRGMELPAGHHTIEFKFEPEGYKVGNRASLFGSLTLLLACLWGAYMDRKKQSPASAK